MAEVFVIGNSGVSRAEADTSVMGTLAFREKDGRKQHRVSAMKVGPGGTPLWSMPKWVDAALVFDTIAAATDASKKAMSAMRKGDRLTDAVIRARPLSGQRPRRAS